MALSTEQKQQIVNDYQRASGDTGSPEVQVALLSANIQDLTSHFQEHKHDHGNHAKYGSEYQGFFFSKFALR